MERNTFKYLNEEEVYAKVQKHIESIEYEYNLYVDMMECIKQGDGKFIKSDLIRIFNDLVEKHKKENPDNVYEMVINHSRNEERIEFHVFYGGQIHDILMSIYIGSPCKRYIDYYYIRDHEYNTPYKGLKSYAQQIKDRLNMIPEAVEKWNKGIKLIEEASEIGYDDTKKIYPYATIFM